jgi:hypothetical protein
VARRDGQPRGCSSGAVEELWRRSACAMPRLAAHPPAGEVWAITLRFARLFWIARRGAQPFACGSRLAGPLRLGPPSRLLTISKAEPANLRGIQKQVPSPLALLVAAKEERARTVRTGLPHRSRPELPVGRAAAICRLLTLQSTCDRPPQSTAARPTPTATMDSTAGPGRLSCSKVVAA